MRSRKSTEGTAEKMSRFVESKLSVSEKEELNGLQIHSESPGYDKLIPLLKRGVGYHHVGMLSEQRRLVEKLFRVLPLDPSSMLCISSKNDEPEIVEYGGIVPEE